MKIRPLGDINHDLEHLCFRWVDNYSANWSNILMTFYKEFVKYKNCQEVYEEDNSNPILKIKKVSGLDLNSYDKKLLSKLLKEYFLSHDMQWGEVLAQVYQYLQTHLESSKDKNFYFYYGS